ncbi:MAG: tRNA1(Val) (adenine(37)-N6)-methyltransferase [Solirubrobacterales bacterium]
MLTGGDDPTTCDRFLGGRLTVRQPAEGYRAGSDPVFLAATVPARANDRVLDLGCGVGTAGLCLLARVAGVTVTGLELQPGLAALARANAAENHLVERLTVVEGSLTDPPDLGPGFDHVITNPPWYEAGTVNRPRTATKAIGHVEGDVDLGAWLKAAVGYLKPKGRLFVIHRADRLGDILAALGRCPVGAVRVLPLWPRAGKPAIRVIVSARRNARTPLEMLPGVVLHREGGGYSDIAEAVLRHGAALD